MPRILEVGALVEVGGRRVIVEEMKYEGTRAKILGRWIAASVCVVVASAAEVAAAREVRSRQAARAFDRTLDRFHDALDAAERAHSLPDTSGLRHFAEGLSSRRAYAESIRVHDEIENELERRHS
jgi:hypothetical protein